MAKCLKVIKMKANHPFQHICFIFILTFNIISSYQDYESNIIKNKLK